MQPCRQGRIMKNCFAAAAHPCRDEGAMHAPLKRLAYVLIIVVMASCMTVMMPCCGLACQ